MLKLSELNVFDIKQNCGGQVTQIKSLKGYFGKKINIGDSKVYFTLIIL